MTEEYDLEKAKEFFAKEDGGKAVFEHLAEVVMKILIDKPADSLSQFELYSARVKESKCGEKVVCKSSTSAVEAEQLLKRQTWVNSTFPMFKKPPEEGEEVPEEEGAEEEALSDPGTIQDVVHEMEALKWADVGIGREDAFRIYLSLFRLSAKNSGINLRFWGKILGTHADYYIAESESGEDGGAGGEEEEEANADIEVEGPNKYTYYATNTVGGPWVKLPKVSATQIREARKIKRYFTGNLEAIVPGHPPFPGKEKDFLRAQVARISSSTQLCPQGLFRPLEGDDPLATEPIPEDEAGAPPSLHALQSPAGWVHLTPELNAQGRCAPKVITNEEGEEVTDPSGPPLVPVLSSLAGEAASWTLRTHPHVALGAAPRMVAVRSNRWPGAVAVGTGPRFTNVYVGYGVKFAKNAYSPEPPFPLALEASLQPYQCQSDVLEDPHPPKSQEAEGQEAEGQEEEQPEEEEEEN